MTGFVYKELKQNLRYILLTVVSGFVALIVLVLFRDSYNAHDYNILLMLGLIGGLLLAGGMEMAVLNGDDRRLWAYFVSSTSDGYKGFLRVKYEMIFVMSLLFLTSFSLCEQLITAIATDKGMMVESSASAIAVPLVFIQFLLRSVDIPLFYRFGAKKGNTIKLISVLAMIVVLFTVLLINIDRFEDVYGFVCKAFTKYTRSPLLPAGAVAALAAYYASYRISCRVYLKGAETYDK